MRLGGGGGRWGGVCGVVRLGFGAVGVARRSGLGAGSATGAIVVPAGVLLPVLLTITVTIALLKYLRSMSTTATLTLTIAITITIATGPEPAPND